VIVRHSVAGQALGVCHKHAKVQGQDYGDDGCTITIEIAPGDYDKLLNELNGATKGDYQFRMAGAAASAEPTDDDGGKKKKGGKKK